MSEDKADKLVNTSTLRYGDDLRDMIAEYMRWAIAETGIEPSQGDVIRVLAQRGYRAWKATQATKDQKKKGRVT